MGLMNLIVFRLLVSTAYVARNLHHAPSHVEVVNFALDKTLATISHFTADDKISLLLKTAKPTNGYDGTIVIVFCIFRSGGSVQYISLAFAFCMRSIMLLFTAC